MKVVSFLISALALSAIALPANAQAPDSGVLLNFSTSCADSSCKCLFTSNGGRDEENATYTKLCEDSSKACFPLRVTSPSFTIAALKGGEANWEVPRLRVANMLGSNKHLYFSFVTFDHDNKNPSEEASGDAPLGGCKSMGQDAVTYRVCFLGSCHPDAHTNHLQNSIV
mmetsp:Transcript_85262/g.151011  ORF Transcript_85262/g.151011 Transcript_85262/m.151011 type:complete len:169 (+) Transcript_85262:51-557(+)